MYFFDLFCVLDGSNEHSHFARGLLKPVVG
jgi:hypothetical protein